MHHVPTTRDDVTRSHHTTYKVELLTGAAFLAVPVSTGAESPAGWVLVIRTGEWGI
jgi:hypothetical protein